MRKKQKQIINNLCSATCVCERAAKNHSILLPIYHLSQKNGITANGIVLPEPAIYKKISIKTAHAKLTVFHPAVLHWNNCCIEQYPNYRDQPPRETVVYSCSQYNVFDRQTVIAFFAGIYLVKLDREKRFPTVDAVVSTWKADLIGRYISTKYPPAGILRGWRYATRVWLGHQSGNSANGSAVARINLLSKNARYCHGLFAAVSIHVSCFARQSVSPLYHGGD